MDLGLDPLPHISLIAASHMAALHQDRTRLPIDQRTFLVEKACVSRRKVPRHNLEALEVVLHREVEAVSTPVTETHEMQETDPFIEETVNIIGIVENRQTLEKGGLLPQTQTDQDRLIPPPFVMEETNPLVTQTCRLDII